MSFAPGPYWGQPPEPHSPTATVHISSVFVCGSELQTSCAPPVLNNYSSIVLTLQDFKDFDDGGSEVSSAEGSGYHTQHCGYFSF